ncbi:MAG: phosphoethanolamine--lipid A transferase [Gammaproteobacteria bacterium]|nr:phosphoethanolamine--lipid A transferase [Gammaproteobacteria bacterium]
MLTLPTRLRLSTNQLALLLSIWLLTFYNGPLWQLVLSRPFDSPLSAWLFSASFFALIVACFNLLLSLVAFPYLLKPAAILLLFTAAPVSYFMDSYGVIIDKSMIQNVLQTDSAEAGDLFSLKLLLYLFVLALLPTLLVLKLPLKQRSLWHEVRGSLISAVASVAVIAAVAALFYADYASFFRNNPQIRLLLTPSNTFYSGYKQVASLLKTPTVIRPIGTDANRLVTTAGRSKPSVLVLVVGETARAQNFSLNGYSRPTNPQLEQAGVINFRNAYACGTSTAISVPCMFSRLEREDYSGARAAAEENLLDVLRHAGIEVLWRDNSSGCKGLCERVTTERRNAFRSDALCPDGECFDEAMLTGLEDYLDKLTGDAVIVLHQMGSHGPAYYKRYPEAFRVFEPTCDSNQLQSCSAEAIRNTYDNTLLYTDHFLHRVITFLQARSERYDTAMLYLSDHGESLGENNLYLHGMPYFMAPEEQKRVPFLLWLSDNFTTRYQVDSGCLGDNSEAPISHDNLFHSVLGLLDVRTRLYQPELDIFAPCRVTAQRSVAALKM